MTAEKNRQSGGGAEDGQQGYNERRKRSEYLQARRLPSRGRRHFTPLLFVLSILLGSSLHHLNVQIFQQIGLLGPLCPGIYFPSSSWTQADNMCTPQGSRDAFTSYRLMFSDLGRFTPRLTSFLLTSRTLSAFLSIYKPC